MPLSCCFGVVLRESETGPAHRLMRHHTYVCDPPVSAPPPSPESETAPRARHPSPASPVARPRSEAHPWRMSTPHSSFAHELGPIADDAPRAHAGARTGTRAHPDSPGPRAHSGIPRAHDSLDSRDSRSRQRRPTHEILHVSAAASCAFLEASRSSRRASRIACSALPLGVRKRGCSASSGGGGTSGRPCAPAPLR